MTTPAWNLSLKEVKVGMKTKYTFAPDDLDPKGPIFARSPALETGY